MGDVDKDNLSKYSNADLKLLEAQLEECGGFMLSHSSDIARVVLDEPRTFVVSVSANDGMPKVEMRLNWKNMF